jgi:DNA-binding transcriptional MocR family regulator
LSTPAAEQILEELKSLFVEPSARGLADAVSRGVRDGAFQAGVVLPSIRAIAARLQLSTSTVSAAWAMLSKAGVIHTDGRRGTVIADRQVPGPARYRRALEYSARFEFDLSSGLPDPMLLPDLVPALHRLPAARPLRTYLDSPVMPELHDQLHARWPYRADAITVADGLMDALDLIISTALRYGDRVAVEQPTDPSLLDLLEVMGARVITVELDEAGPVPSSLTAAVDGGARTVFVQPRAQNPTGVCVSRQRVDELAGIVRRTEALVVEIDYQGAVASAPMWSLGRVIADRTVHIHGFSASHGPELRIAAIGGPTEFIDTLVHRRHLGQGWTSRLLQMLLTDLLDDAAATTQIEAARDEYARRRRTLVAELDRRNVAVPGSDGWYIWMPVASEPAALVSLTSRSIGAAPGTPFWIRPDAEPHLSLTSALLPTDHAAEIADALADAALPKVRGGRL